MISNFNKYIPDKTEPYVIFDIGSRDCMQSIEFYNAYPNAKIYAFECNPNTIHICKSNIKNYRDRITLIEGAVADYDGNITFYPINKEKTITTWKDGNQGASSLFVANGTYPAEKYVQDEVVVNCHRLDTVMAKYNIPMVDIIWMDLQGAELLALKGLGTHLNDVQYIHVEVSHRAIYTGQVVFNELHPFILQNQFELKNKLSYKGFQEDAIYYKRKQVKVEPLFDIVIPLGPNDLTMVHKQIEFTKNVIGYRNIYIITFDDDIHIDGCIMVSEKQFPFSLDIVAEYHGKNKRNGWYLQQLLKLYAGHVIPDIMDKYLVIDADTCFIKPTTFVENGKCLYNYGTEYHIPYFIHMQRLHPSLKKQIQEISGICHHMIFEREFVKELLNEVETYHQGEPFYKVFLRCVDPGHIEGSGASEYEIYFNFLLSAHPEKIDIRNLSFLNTGNFDVLNQPNHFNYISVHSYMRN
jgi:FkbM family methyltransferase